MKPFKRNRNLVLLLSAILVTSILYNIPFDSRIDLTYTTSLLPREGIIIAATYTPGDFPSGLTLSDGDVLNGSSGGIYNITGNFTIMSGATVTIVGGHKIVIVANNIIIAGTLDGNGAGYNGGPGGPILSAGSDGSCDPLSGAGSGGSSQMMGGGGGAYGNDGQSAVGGAGGQEYGLTEFEFPVPTFSDIKMGAGGGGGAGGDISGGNGGAGGGGVYLEAQGDLLINGSILCNGNMGQDAGNSVYDFGAGGGGGGAGGGILLYGNNILIPGVLNAIGGERGSGGDALLGIPGFSGGAGSGGRIKIAYWTSLNTTGSSISIDGGDSSTPLGTFHTYEMDKTPPTIFLLSPANSTIHLMSTSVLVNTSDLLFLQQVQYRWDYGPYTTVLLNTTLYNVTTFLPPYDGEHILEVLAQDYTGNWNSEVFSFTFDVYSPSILLMTPDNNTVHQSGSTLHFDVFDTIALSQVWHSWDGGTNTTFLEPFDLLLPVGEGPHNLTIYAQDTAGRWSTEAYSFVTDDTSPMITSPADIVYYENATGYNITWVLDDLHPESYEVTLDGVTIQSGIWNSGSEVEVSADTLSVGTHVFTIIVFDVANNLFLDTVSVTVLEVSTSTITNTTTTSEFPIESALILFTSGGLVGGIVVILVVIGMKRRNRST